MSAIYHTRTRLQGAIAGGNTARWSLTENIAAKSGLPQETKMSIQVKCKPVDVKFTCYLTIANGVRENSFELTQIRLSIKLLFFWRSVSRSMGVYNGRQDLKLAGQRFRESLYIMGYIVSTARLPHLYSRYIF